ncbi:MAG: SCO family protein, partial [Vicinamibacterales bacterium]
PTLRQRRVALAVLLAAFAAACGGRRDRFEYTLQGQILSIEETRLQANIRHEEIPGFMPAMTMPYKVRDAAEFEELAPGDLLTATLVVESNDAYLMDVQRVGEAPLEQPAQPAPSARSGLEMLQPGEQVPDVTFVDQEGRERTFASFAGSTLVVTFIYTRCPMPTFCPLMDRHFVEIQKQLEADAALGNVHLVTISFDPVTDTPPVLKAHAETLGANPARWTFLTGDRDEVDRFAMRFGVSLMREGIDARDITHNLRTAIVDPQGRLVKAYTGNEWTPDEVVADLRQGRAAH